jgi:hypothetical protein
MYVVHVLCIIHVHVAHARIKYAYILEYSCNCNYAQEDCNNIPQGTKNNFL